MVLIYFSSLPGLSEPTDYELEVAEFQGAEFGKVVSRMSSE